MSELAISTHRGLVVVKAHRNGKTISVPFKPATAEKVGWALIKASGLCEKAMVFEGYTPERAK